MALIVSLKNERQNNRPGSPYRATIELTNPHELDVIDVVEALSVTCRGLEVLDPVWVSSKYYDQSGAPPYRKDKRRIVRTLFSASSPQLLEKLLFLAPGQEKNFSILCNLPEKLPPSFRGTSVRYVYELLVGVKYRQAVYGERDALKKSVENQKPQCISFRSTFSVFNDFSANKSVDDEVVPMTEVYYRTEDEILLQWSEPSDDDKTSSTEGSILSKVISDSAESSSTFRLGLGCHSEAMSVSRLSLPETETSYTSKVRRRQPSISHADSQMLVGLCVRPQTFNLRFGNETVVLFSFNPSMGRPLRLGSTLGGVLYLKNGSRSEWRCQSYTVMLETEEEVSDAFQRDSPSRDRAIRRLYCEHSEFTGDVLMTNFMFTVPSNAPPSFTTPLVSLKWVLKFEFEVGRREEWSEAGDMPSVTHATEPLKWQLPLTVHPH